MYRVTIDVEIKNTEDPGRVTQAVLNLFPDARVEIRGNQLTASTENIDEFRDLLEKQRIRDTARDQLLKGAHNHKIMFRVNKQSAYLKKINFSVVDHPLGDIMVAIQCDNPDELIKYLTQGKKN